MSHTDHSAVDLYWLPLGAGGHFVRVNGRAYETVAARMARRPACALYHSALEVRLDSERFVIEMAPIFDAPPEQRGVVAQGPVGARWAGRARLFRYGIRRWLDGRLPDVDEAVDSPHRLSDQRAHDVCLTSSRRCRRRCGAGMNYRPAACGTRTP